MSEARRRGKFARFFGASILIQGLLSAANLLVGLLLIRRTSDLDYSYYVLVSNAILLLTSLQYAYAYPSLIYSITSDSGTAKTRGDFMGGLCRELRTVLLVVVAALAAAATIGRVAGLIGGELYAIAIVAIAAGAFGLYRELFRMVLMARRGQEILLRGDVVYVVILVASAAAATLYPHPAIWAILGLGLAAFAAGRWLKGAAFRQEPWNMQGRRGLLRDISAVGAWATAGAAGYWAFSQGYNYMVAGVLSIPAVASIAATRILIMPVNLLSLGIGNVMLPTVSGWLQRIDTRTVMFRQVMVMIGLSIAAGVYLLLLWLFRDWIFANLLKKSFADRDHLLLVWFVVAIFMVFRDQLSYLLMARARFRETSILTMASAVISLLTGFLLIRSMGAVGSLLGLLLGEVVNVLGIIVLCQVEIRRNPHPGAPTA